VGALFVAVSFLITYPRLLPNSAGTGRSRSRGTSISVIGLYIAYTIPVFLRWRAGDRFEPGAVDARQEVQWVNLNRVRLGGPQRGLPLLSAQPGCGAWQRGVQLELGQHYAPLVVVFVMLCVTIWLLRWARKTFKGRFARSTMQPSAPTRTSRRGC